MNLARERKIERERRRGEGYLETRADSEKYRAGMECRKPVPTEKQAIRVAQEGEKTEENGEETRASNR